MLRPPECPLNNDSLSDDPAMMRDFVSQRNRDAYVERPGNICDHNYQGQDTGGALCINNSHFYIHQAALSLRSWIPDCPRRVVPEKQGRYTLDSALHTLTSTELMDTVIVQLTFFF